VASSGHHRPLLSALWTEARLTYPALDALREGYELYPVKDPAGGNTVMGEAAWRDSTEADWRETCQLGYLGLRTVQCDWIHKWTDVAAFRDVIETSGARGPLVLLWQGVPRLKVNGGNYAKTWDRTCSGGLHRNCMPVVWTSPTGAAGAHGSSNGGGNGQWIHGD
jgi:hypothetical protein